PKLQRRRSHHRADHAKHARCKRRRANQADDAENLPRNPAGRRPDQDRQSGMLATRANAEVVRDFLESNAALPGVLDPVLRSSSGMELLDAAGFEFLRDHLLPHALVVTPNAEEAAALTSLKVENVEGMKAAAYKLVEMGARAVVVTGGHLEKPVDVYFDGTELEAFAADRVKSDNFHGTGCAFSS